MQHAQHRQPIAVRQLAQQAHDAVRRLGIQAGDRFIRQQQARPLRQSARDRHALRLAARQSAGALSRQMREPDAAEMRMRGPHCLGRQAAKRGPQGLVPAQRPGRDIGGHAAAADQVRLLPDHRDIQPRAAQRLARQAGQFGAVQPDLARRRRQRAIDTAQ